MGFQILQFDNDTMQHVDAVLRANDTGNRKCLKHCPYNCPEWQWHDGKQWKPDPTLQIKCHFSPGMIMMTCSSLNNNINMQNTIITHHILNPYCITL